MAEVKTLYFSGGRFWGLEEYFSVIKGVIGTKVGYVNGTMENPSFEQVNSGETNYVEAVQVRYDPSVISTGFLTHLYFESVNPLTAGKQGKDDGTQFACHIFDADAEQKLVIDKAIDYLTDFYEYHLKSTTKVNIPVKELSRFVEAEEEQQNYLKKHSDAYCQIPDEKIKAAAQAVVDPSLYYLGSPVVYLNKLTKEQFSVTQKGVPEPEFENEYYNCFDPGIYVDVITDEPLFSSKDKFKHEAGWPCFSQPIDSLTVWSFINLKDGKKTFREVHSRMGDTALGFLFKDGPEKSGGKRYLIFSGALRFIPADEMQEQGYGYLLDYI